MEMGASFSALDEQWRVLIPVVAKILDDGTTDPTEGYCLAEPVCLSLFGLFASFD